MNCKYRCQQCKYEFEEEKPGQVTCPKCGHLYIDWLNFKAVIKSLKIEMKGGVGSGNYGYSGRPREVGNSEMR